MKGLKDFEFLLKFIYVVNGRAFWESRVLYMKFAGLCIRSLISEEQSPLKLTIEESQTANAYNWQMIYPKIIGKLYRR